MTDIETQSSVKKWFIKNGVEGLNLNTLPRCQATAKSTGKRCKCPAMNGRDVCCIHAGLFTPGAPKGNQRGLKHGHYTAKAIAERRDAKKLLTEAEEFLAMLS